MENINQPTKETPKMNKRVLIIVSLLAVLVLVLAAYFAGSYLRKEPKKEAEKPAAGSVSITKDGFSPATIEVKKGDKLEWTNLDSAPHQIASDPHPTHTALTGLVSTALTKGESYSFTFTKSGTYTYHDHLNPLQIKGTVVVK